MNEIWFSKDKIPHLKPIDNFLRQSELLLVKDINNDIFLATLHTDTVNRKMVWENQQGKTIQVKSWKYLYNADNEKEFVKTILNQLCFPIMLRKMWSGSEVQDWIFKQITPFIKD